MSHVYSKLDDETMVAFIVNEVEILQSAFVTELSKVITIEEAALRAFTSGKALLLCRLQREFNLDIPYDSHLILLNLLANYVVYK